MIIHKNKIQTNLIVTLTRKMDGFFSKDSQNEQGKFVTTLALFVLFLN